MGSETLPSACYILSHESSIPFYSTSTGKASVFFEIYTLDSLEFLLPNVDEQDLHLLNPPQFATGSSRIIDCKIKSNKLLQI